MTQASDGWTLDDALNFGRGIERPFRCSEHDDTNASASVNVLKNVWYCYACGAAGTVDGKKAPSAAQLAAMLNPEKSCRVYPATWLELFADHGYWADRFPDWVCHWLGFGMDPFTGDAVFPVRTAEGRLAGVGRRLAEPAEDEPRYKYPHRWSASRTMFGYDHANHRDPVGVLVEGAADNAAVREAGFDVFSIYGSGVHAPQYELVRRLNKKVWLVGTDMDDAGEKAAEAALETLAPDYYVARVNWKEKDPGDCDLAARVVAIHNALKTVGAGPYSDLDALIPIWVAQSDLRQRQYTEWCKEVAA